MFGKSLANFSTPEQKKPFRTLSPDTVTLAELTPSLLAARQVYTQASLSASKSSTTRENRYSSDPSSCRVRRREEPRSTPSLKESSRNHSTLGREWE